MKRLMSNNRDDNPTMAGPAGNGGSGRPCGIAEADLASVMDVLLDARGGIARLTPEMIRNLVLKGALTAVARAGVPGKGSLVPLAQCEGLVPYGPLAEQALELYRRGAQAEADCPDYTAVCERYLAFAGERTDMPGLSLVHILMYFAQRGPSVSAALNHLLKAMALEYGDPPGSLLGPILNDLGVLFLLYLNAPRQAAMMFGASVCRGYHRTDAGLANLCLMDRIAHSNRIRLPGLAETLASARMHVARHGQLQPAPRQCRHVRPDPLCENWAWYLEESDVSPAMLSCPGDQAPRNHQAILRVPETLQHLDDPLHSALLTAASETLPILEPLASLAQDQIEIARQGQYQAERQFQFLSSANRANSALEAGDFDQTETHLRAMFANAVTPAQKRQAELLARDITHARASHGQGPGYDLVDGVTSGRARHADEDATAREIVAGIDALLAEEKFEQADALCHTLKLLETVPASIAEAHCARVRASAESAIARRIRDALTPPNYAFAAAEEALQEALRLGLNDGFCKARRDSINACRELALRRDVLQAADQGHFDAAMEIIHRTLGDIPEKTIRELTELVLARRQVHEQAGSRRRLLLEEALKEAAGGTEGSQPPAVLPLDIALSVISAKAPPESAARAWQACAQAYQAMGRKDWAAMAKALRALHVFTGKAQPLAGLVRQCMQGIASETAGGRRRLATAVRLLPEIDDESEVRRRLLAELSKRGGAWQWIRRRIIR